IMRRQGSGRIVNISSVAGKIARPLSSVYDSTKHALEALSDGMRGEMAPFGVQVVIVEPGFILTEFTEVADKVSASMTYQNTPYSPAYSPFSQGAGRLRKIAGKSDDIARVVERALTAGRPRIRYAAPKHAKVFIALKRFLPARLIDYIVARQTGMTEERLQATGSNPSRVSEGDLKSDGSS
ncbi:MAG TPA: SDR family NAD(P)-dependent oxidoreductase, partial [Blastocatellia bacterium]|nr:SDR family NAD(P)-dependent oxidoreductase [Blastocatellia bacterium]